MPAAYLHGVETLSALVGGFPVKVVKSAVIALIGVAPTGDKNKLTLVTSLTDAAQFGEKIPGFNIPKALDAIFKQGSATVLVVNVYDETTNAVAVTAETVAVLNYKGKTAFAPIGVARPVVKDNGATITYIEGTDYSIDSFGKIQVLPGSAIVEGANLKVTYKKLDATTVTSSQLIGTFNSGTGVRTGMQNFDLAFTNFGFKAKILIAPGYSTLAPVAAELLVKANLYKGVTFIDAPIGTVPTAVVTGRGPAGTLAGFNSSSDRVFLLYPHMKAYDAYTDADENQPLSQFAAGATAATDNNEGYWVSPSNHQILGVTGVERSLTAAIDDEGTETNLLNSVGVTTIFNSFGTGLLLWGNRTAAWPVQSTPNTFLCVRRTADVIDESIRLAMMPYIDKPLNNAILDTVRESVNGFLRSLQGKGAIIDGTCTFDKAKNPQDELALGHATFDYNFMPPVPGERFTFNSYIDTSLLAKLG